LGAVTLVDAKGDPVRGQGSPDGTWAITELLHPFAVYTFTLTATGPDGTATTTRSTFSP
jgi:hypothetical protein